MKKFFTLAVLALLAIGCAKEYDDTPIRDLIAGLDARISELETSISAIQSTVGDGKFVRKVEEYKDPDTGRTTGITVTYTDGNVVHFNIVPADPTQGPVFSVIRNGAGELVWAVDGVTVKMDGADVPVYQTPVFTIDEEGNLLVEVDGKTTNLGPVKSEGATLQDGIFTNLAVTDEAVVLTLADGSTVNIPFAEAFRLNIENTEFTFSGLDPIEIPYTVSAKTEGTVVGVAGYSPKEFSVAVEADKIVVTPLSAKSSGVLLAYADSKVGLTSLVSITVEAEGFEVTDEPYDIEVDYMAPGEDAVVTVNAVSNISFEVKPVEEWIHVASVKSQAYTITLKLDDNKTGEIREGVVYFLKAGTEESVQTIRIAQLPAIDELGPKNLSKKGAANSYIVTEAGEYKFWAVKGNSGIEVNPASVEVLWETWNNAEEVAANSVVASVSLSGSYVVFSTPETLKPGNAVIAAKDAGGVILWSWHIWVPETEIVTADYGIYPAPMMDRNLGALVAATADAAAPVESFGLTYQWGRKDPFPGPKAVKSGDNATVAGVAVSTKPGNGTSAESCMTVEETIANPTVLGFTQNGDWLPAELADNTLWQNEVKTMYDPCPPGYRVPARNTESAFHSSDLSTATGWQDNAANNWFALGDPLAVFPFAGYRDDYSPGGMTHAYDRGAYWTAYSSQAAKAYYVNVRSGSAHARAEAGKSRAGSVRCVSAEETPILPPDEPTEPTGSATDLSETASANSYIVTKAGNYMFKAVKGNSDESVGAVAKAEVLWETDNTATAPEVGAIIATVDFAGGYVAFSTPETLKPGNALIAVKDASDAILWSWHIWIPATEVKVWDSEALCGAKMLDRNLGALVDTGASGDVDPLSIGLYYQWGRKDPFPGATEFVKSPAGAAVAGTAWTYHKELITTDYSVAHPTEYASVPEVDAGVWNADDPQDLWNTADDKKTVYDPCPPGYRVPLYDKSLPMWAGTDEGFTFDGNRVSYGDFHFTVAGYIDCWSAGYSYANLRTHIWASKWYDAERSTCAYFRLDKDPKYYAQKYHKAKAGSVRCVAE
ncbi:MAG: hypothetical protein IJP73_05775 [Bacteroidales bacterium]|nr:hypothetical protein [Bacteroidales bacterium]